MWTCESTIVIAIYCLLSPFIPRASRKKVALVLQLLDLANYSLRRFFTSADAVGNPDAMVSATGQREARELHELCFDPLNTCLMSNVILRHGTRMAPDARENRWSDHTQQARDFVAYIFLHCCIVVVK